MTNPETPERATVERFRPVLEPKKVGYMMGTDRDGSWVRHADYLTLAAETQRLRERLAESHEVIVTLTECADAANTRARQAEDEAQRLREEHARLQYFADQVERLNTINRERAEKAEQDLARLRADKDSGAE